MECHVFPAHRQCAGSPPRQRPQRCQTSPDDRQSKTWKLLVSNSKHFQNNSKEKLCVAARVIPGRSQKYSALWRLVLFSQPEPSSRRANSDVSSSCRLLMGTRGTLPRRPVSSTRPSARSSSGGSARNLQSLALRHSEERSL